MKEQIEIIRCDEIGCNCVVATRRRDGYIVIKARHHGREHTTFVPPQFPTAQIEEPLPEAPRVDTMR